MAWPVFYNLRNLTGNEETNTTFPFLHNLRNLTGNEETNTTFSVLHNLRNPTGNEETNTTLPVFDNQMEILKSFLINKCGVVKFCMDSFILTNKNYALTLYLT